MTDTEKDYITIKLCRDEASGVYYTHIERSEEAKRKLELTFNNQEGHCIHLTKEGAFLFYSYADREKYCEANPDKTETSLTITAAPSAEKQPLPGAISPMGIYENYFMPTGYKPLKDTKL
jgi:hypothetical protein